jgi:hypothetical protein
MALLSILSIFLLPWFVSFSSVFSLLETLTVTVTSVSAPVSHVRKVFEEKLESKVLKTFFSSSMTLRKIG